MCQAHQQQKQTSWFSLLNQLWQWPCCLGVTRSFCTHHPSIISFACKIPALATSSGWKAKNEVRSIMSFYPLIESLRSKADRIPCRWSLVMQLKITADTQHPHRRRHWWAVLKCEYQSNCHTHSFYPTPKITTYQRQSFDLAEVLVWIWAEWENKLTKLVGSIWSTPPPPKWWPVTSCILLTHIRFSEFHGNSRSKISTFGPD